jgi:hypothetical protein
MNAFGQRVMTQPLSSWRNASLRLVSYASICGAVGCASGDTPDEEAVWQPASTVASSETADVGTDRPTSVSSAVVSTAAPTASSSQGQPSEPAAQDSTAPLMAGVRQGFATRISKSEYQASILDALNVNLTEADLSAASGALPDDGGDGVFKRFGDKQTTVEQHAAGLWHLAQLVTERVSTRALIAAGKGCSDANQTCLDTVVAQVGKQLFRRSLDERELATFGQVGAAALGEGEELESAVQWSLMALLQAPQFVFHLTDETKGTKDMKRPLSAVELSARLASFIWNSVPDAELLAVAQAGTLADAAELDAQVKRMLADPKARRMTENFIRDFSRAEKASFVDATDDDREALRQSMVETFQAHVWESNRSLAELFTTTDFVVNARTAELLGLPNAVDDLTHVDVSNLPERVGILTHPGSLAGMGDQLIGSFVNRGKYLMERLLCQHPIAVPDALAGELEAFKMDTTGLNELERVAIRKTRSECWGCHAQFEPFAFGFVRFDGAGRYLGEQDDQGKPLPLDGWVPIAPEADAPHYDNMTEYMQILSTQPRVQQCMTEHFLSYATANSPDALTRAAAPTVGEEYQSNGETLTAMVSAVVHSDIFRHILVQAPPSTSKEGN